MQLAIDTSTDTASLALIEEGNVLAELTWRCQQNHSTQLLPHLEHLLDQLKLDQQAINAIIVARGPGTYNGLRVGVSTAKGLAYSLEIPIVGISTLEAEAYQHTTSNLPICPILNAGREEIATAEYQMKDGQWQQLVDEHLTTVNALCSEITNQTLFCGEYVAAIATQLKEQLKQRAVTVTPAARLRRAVFLAELGNKRLMAGDHDDPLTLQPVYLRGPNITQPKHR